MGAKLVLDSSLGCFCRLPLQVPDIVTLPIYFAVHCVTFVIYVRRTAFAIEELAFLDWQP